MIALRHELPDLSGLTQTNFLGLAMAQIWEARKWKDPLNRQLLTTARLVDKAITDYERARVAFDKQDRQKEGMSAFFRPHKRGVTVHFVLAIGHMEDLVIALDRALKILPALLAAPELIALKELPVPGEAAQARVKRFRNRIAHGDEDLERSKRGTVATLRPYAHGIELRGVGLEFAELAEWLQQLHDYVLGVNRIA